MRRRSHVLFILHSNLAAIMCLAIKKQNAGYIIEKVGKYIGMRLLCPTMTKACKNFEGVWYVSLKILRMRFRFGCSGMARIHVLL